MCSICLSISYVSSFTNTAYQLVDDSYKEKDDENNSYNR